MHIVLNNFSIDYNIYDSLRAWKAPETAEEKEKKAKERAEKLKAKKEKEKDKKRKDDVKSETNDSEEEEPKFLDCNFSLHAFRSVMFMATFYLRSKKVKKEKKQWSCDNPCWSHAWPINGLGIIHETCDHACGRNACWVKILSLPIEMRKWTLHAFCSSGLQVMCL